MAVQPESCLYVVILDVARWRRQTERYDDEFMNIFLVNNLEARRTSPPWSLTPNKYQVLCVSLPRLAHVHDPPKKHDPILYLNSQGKRNESGRICTTYMTMGKVFSSRWEVYDLFRKLFRSIKKGSNDDNNHITQHRVLYVHPYTEWRNATIRRSSCCHFPIMFRPPRLRQDFFLEDSNQPW